MKKFKGFRGGKRDGISVPEDFFSDALPLIDDLAELKVILFSMWLFYQKPGEFRYLRRRDFAANPSFMAGLAIIDPEADTEAMLDAALARAVEHRVLLSHTLTVNRAQETLYFFNTERGRLAVEQLRIDNWQPGDLHNPVEILHPRPNIYKLYEAHIGILSPRIIEFLKDAEAEYPEQWVIEAIEAAAAYNKRSWGYIRVILETWEREGRGHGLVAEDSQQDGTKYISGKYSSYIEY